MDVVWIRLTVDNGPQVTPKETTESFMFGTGGIIRFSPDETETGSLLRFGDPKIAPILVKEDYGYIMNLIQKIRNTGKLFNKPKKTSRRSKK